jgi:hypothetical protein
VVPDSYAGIDVNVASDGYAFFKHGSLAHVTEVPDFDVFLQLSAVFDDSGGMGECNRHT